MRIGDPESDAGEISDLRIDELGFLNDSVKVTPIENDYIRFDISKLSLAIVYRRQAKHFKIVTIDET